ncbi:5-hydroxytryptamine receptor 3 [Sarotherodon galilaeus]
MLPVEEAVAQSLPFTSYSTSVGYTTLFGLNIDRSDYNPSMAGKFDSGKTNDDEVRIVMVGRTGIGKSATGNTILGRWCFESKFSAVSMTVECSKGKAKVDGHRVAVIDTPGLFDTRVDEEETQKNICQCISYASPGPHIFLVVVRLGRFTEEEKHIVQNIQNIYGTDADKYSMVLFTHGDLLGGITMEEFLEGSPDLQELVARCNGQYHVFNNKLKERSQVTELLQKIREIVQKNGGSHYTNEMFQEAERAIEEEKQRILREKEEEKIQKEKEKMEREIQERYEKEMQKYNEQLQAERERERKEREEERKREREEREREMNKLKEKCEREIQERYEKEMQKYNEQLQAERERERKEREEERKREREVMNEERKREMEEREAERKREREEREWEMKKLKEKCERELKKERRKIQSRYENEARDEAEEFNPLFFLIVPAETILNVGHAVVGGVKKLGKMLKTTFTF